MLDSEVWDRCRNANNTRTSRNMIQEKKSRHLWCVVMSHLSSVRDVEEPWEVDCSNSSNDSLLKFCIPNPGMRLSFGQFAVPAWPSDFRLTSPDWFRRTIQWAVIFVINGIFWAWMLRFSLMDVGVKLIKLEMLFLYGLPGHFEVIGVQGQQEMHFSSLGNSVRNVLRKGGKERKGYGCNLLKLKRLAPTVLLWTPADWMPLRHCLQNVEWCGKDMKSFAKALPTWTSIPSEVGQDSPMHLG